ncbi:glycosyltransferase family 2 protein [Paraburkholderia tagetis]|uniref:Glycosyltransferase n=1 Tax=Paraburkholderia tagetis TaxID=2913261 RepID=A0A9X1UNN0_9BURK|nr:glycosyltransferase [Paraburkholderia tagetis]MCG5078779.1 glycosyltransferase [Paraburkholderia tagetis]
MKPLVSILTTSYNYERFIGETIRSVIAQTYDFWELLIVDDCSTDGSWDVISKFDDPRIRAVRFEINQGACTAYNTALRMAKGEYIASLDSDDVFHPEKLARQVEFLESNPDVDICGSYLKEIDDTGAAVANESLIYAPWFNRTLDLNAPDCWIWENHLCHSSAIMRKALHDRIGLFREDLTYSPDWNFWLRSLSEGAKFHVIAEELVEYRSHGSNITHRNLNTLMWEYADISATTLHPYLKRIGRPDLVKKNVRIFVKRFFEIDGNWQQFLELMEMLDWRDGHDERFSIAPHFFDDEELTTLVARLSRAWTPKLLALSGTNVSEPGSSGASATALKAQPTELAPSFALNARIERDEARRKLDEAIQENVLTKEREAALAREILELKTQQAALSARLSALQGEHEALNQEYRGLQAQSTIMRTELDRIGQTIWGRGDRLMRWMRGME